MESLAPEDGWFSEIDKNLALSLRQKGEMLFHEKSDFQESKMLIEKLIVFCKNYCQKSKKLKLEIENSIKN